MPAFVSFIVRRLLAVPITLFVITAALYGIIMLAPIETRAELYMPKGQSNNPGLNPEVMRRRVIEENGLNDPYPVQYMRWLSKLLVGDWGWSPILNDDVLNALLIRTPATVELTLYSVILLVPLGIASGVVAAWRRNRTEDFGFRFSAFIATSIPPFILGLVLLGIFYAGLNWFPPGRVGIPTDLFIDFTEFKNYTGLITVDGMLNGRLDITTEAFRHLLLPVVTLSLAHWATLGRVTRC